MKEISENRIREMATEYGIFEDQGRNPGYYLFTDGIKAAMEEQPDKCQCGESSGWTEVKCCNLCGLPIQSEEWHHTKQPQDDKGIVGLVKAWMSEYGECHTDEDVEAVCQRYWFWFEEALKLSTEPDYEPYGPEWEKEMMKMKKADIIQFYKRAVKQPTRQGDECPNQT